MNINLFPFTVLWMILSMVVIGLLMYRKWVAKDEDDSLHVRDAEIGITLKQQTMARKLTSIDRWGKALTAGALVYGLFMGALYLFQLYQNQAARTTELWR